MNLKESLYQHLDFDFSENEYRFNQANVDENKDPQELDLEESYRLAEAYEMDHPDMVELLIKLWKSEADSQ